MCDKASENQEISNEAKTGTFKISFGKYKDSIDTIVKIIGIGVALTTLILIKCQIDGITKQNKAIWYSNRPILRILPIKPDKDLMLSTKNVNPFPDSTSKYELKLTIENVGNTPASFGSVYYEAVHEKVEMSDTVNHDGIILPPKDRLAEIAILRLSINKSTIFKFHISYFWEKSVDRSEIFNYKRYYLVKYLNKT